MATETPTKPKAKTTKATTTKSSASITRTVGYTREDGTTGTHDVYVDPDGNVLPYSRGSVLVIDSYERDLAAAHLAADQDAIADIQADYEDARQKAVRRLHDRASKNRGDA